MSLKQINIIPETNIFKLFQKIIKLPDFQYTQDINVIEKDVKVNSLNSIYRIKVEWQDENQSSYEMWEVIEWKVLKQIE